MKKTLLAAALVTGFAGVAHAESSVTLYGLVDAGYGYTNQKITQGGSSVKNRDIGFKSSTKNGNRWGLKGVEDLGNGTSAIFQLESGFAVGDGHHAQSGRLFGRQAFVGLTGESWGTFTLGRQYNAADAFVAPIDPFGTGWGQAAGVSGFGGVISTRYDNAIKYVSPNFSGFQFGVGVVHSDSKDTIKNGNTTRTVKDRASGVTAGAGYTAGALYLGASYDYLNSKYSDSANPNASTSGKTHAWNFGATYDLDVVKLHALVGQQRGAAIDGVGLAADLLDAVPSTAGFAGKGLRQTSWLAGVTAPVGDAGKVLFSYQGNNLKNNHVTALDGLKVKSHIFSLGYQHSLSKRTAVYGVASYGQSKLKAENRAGTDAKLKSTEVVVGLQHRF